MISIIVPVYNAERTLHNCVRSILDQTFQDFELILVDDGSKDRSGLFCNEIQEECRTNNVPCQVIHQGNRGVSAARNCGMEHAGGEYFVFIDSDDVIEPSYLEDLAGAVEPYAEHGHVLCGFKCTSHKHDYILTDSEPVSILSRQDYMLLFEKILIQSPCLALYRTEIVRRYKVRMREDLSLAEDILFNLAYLDAIGDVPIVVVNRTNYIYQDEDQASLFRKYRPNLLEINETVNQTLEAYLKKWNVADRASWQRYYNTAFLNYRKALKNTFHQLNPMTKKDKVAFNNAVLEEKRFQEALHQCTVTISPALRRALESGDYRRVLTVERLQNIKQTIIGFFR